MSHLLSRRRISVLGMWLDLTTSHRQTWLFSSTSTYHSTDFVTARSVAHLVVHGTSGSTRFHPSDWRPLEACCRPWTWWCNDATALPGYAILMMMMMMTIIILSPTLLSQADYRLSSSFSPYPRETAPLLCTCGTCGPSTGSAPGHWGVAPTGQSLEETLWTPSYQLAEDD